MHVPGTGWGSVDPGAGLAAGLGNWTGLDLDTGLPDLDDAAEPAGAMLIEDL